MNDYYKNKYLKYKSKYLNLKNMIGGSKVEPLNIDKMYWEMLTTLRVMYKDDTHIHDKLTSIFRNNRPMIIELYNKSLSIGKIEPLIEKLVEELEK